MRGAAAISTLFGLGHLRPAPGTIGSAAAIPLAYILHIIGGGWLLIAATIALTFVAIPAVAAYMVDTGTEDPSEVIVDEVVGQWIALWPLSLGLTLMSAPATQFPYPGWIGAFLLFRLFDIWKPGPIGWADRRGGAVGVMLDDILAGIIAAIIILGAAGVSHGWFS